MKIRIKGASVRRRLSKSEVAMLVSSGRVAEETPFGHTVFRYAVQKQPKGDVLTATFANNEITMYAPEVLIRDWDTNELVSLRAEMPLNEGSLYLLLEKDFQCIDQTDEDQSDNYINPNKSC